MGKSSKEYDTTESDGIKFLFSDNNPFRRKPESDYPPPPPQNPSSARKRSENPNPIPASPSPESKKRKKVKNNDENVAAEVDSRQSRKRKRVTDAIEVQYEKKLFGEIPEKEEVVNIKVGEKRKLKDVEAMEKEPLKNDEEVGFDDEAKLSRTVFVGNLDVKTKKKALIKEFKQFGEIESVRLRSVPITDDKASRRGAILKGKINEAAGRMNAYIVFKNEQSAQAALSKNMSMMGENHIRVDKACPPRKRVKGDDVSQLYERKKTVFVGNLPFDVKDEELYRLFCGADQSETTVEAIRVVRDSTTSLGKGIAYILFKSRDAANTVVRRGGLKIRDRVLRLCHAARTDTMPAKKPEVASRREDRRKRFAEIAKERENASSSNGEKRKPSAASLSYQGARSSKSGTVKKSGLSSRPRAAAYSGNGNASNQGTKRTSTSHYEGKDRKAKRPAVAARKAKQLMMKRKLENGTPDNTHRNKKMRSG